MRYSNIIAASAALAGSASAAPALEKRQNIDTTVLQFALTLEHLENVFYKQALQNFTQQDFMNAGYSADYYNNLRYIASDEQQHVMFLQQALQAAGVTPVQPCTYNFPYADVPSFITLSSVLEGVGTSAYLGGAPLITSKAYLTAAGSILVTEAKHTSYQRAAIGEVPFANAYGTPLDPTSVFTLAAMFITSCPSSNMPLPFTPYPTLTANGKTCTCEEPQCGKPSQYIKREAEPEPLSLDLGVAKVEMCGGSPCKDAHKAKGYGNDDKKHHRGKKNGGHKNVGYHKDYDHKNGGWGSYGGKWDGKNSNYCTPPSAGKSVSFSTLKNIPAGSFVTFVSGLAVVSVPGNVNGKSISATIPMQAQGQTYVFVTSKDEMGTLTAGDVVAGPAVLEVNPPAPQIDFSQA